MTGAQVQQVRQGDAVSKPVAGGYEQINATPDAFGAGAAAALGQDAALVVKTGENAKDAAVRIQTEDNEAAAKVADTTYNTQLRGSLFDPEKGYFTLKGKDAVDAYKPTMEALQKAHDDAVGAMQNPEARKMFSDIATRRLDSALDTMAKHAAIERRTYLDGASIARAADAGSDAVAYGTDPAKREAYLNVGRAEIITFAKDHGEPDDVTKAKLRDFDTKAYSGIVKRMAIDDPMGANDFYKANKQKIDGQQQGPLESFLKEATGRRQASADADAVMGVNVGGSYATKLGAPENGGQYGGTPNPSTNAGGKYQFKDDTFLSVARRADPEGTAGKSDADLLALKKSATPEGAALQDKALATYTKDNEAKLTAEGLKVTDANRYLAHWFGAQGAVNVLKADPSTPIASFFKDGKGADGKFRTAADWAAENWLAGKTVGDVLGIARKRMGDNTTPLPGDASVPTSSDPKATARDMEANLAGYVERAKAQFADNPERLDKALTEIKQRYSIQELQVKAREKVDQTTAWQIAMTPNAQGARPTSQDAIPPDLWVRLDPLHQKALQAQFLHNAKGTEPPDNPGLYYALNREAQDDPAAFKSRDLFLVKPQLPNHRWDDLVHLQRSIDKADAKEYKITDAMRVAEGPLRQAGFDLSATAGAKDKGVLGTFTSSLQDWITRYQTENKRPPKTEEVLKQVDQMLIQGRVHGDGFMGFDWSFGSTKQVDGPHGQKGTKGSMPNGTFNFQVTPENREKFYVPFDSIPVDRRAAMEKSLVTKGLLQAGGSSDSARRKVIENAYSAYLAGGGR